MTNLRFEKEEKNPRKNKKKIEIWKKNPKEECEKS